MLYFWDEYVQNVLTCLFQSRDFNKRPIVGYYVCNKNTHTALLLLFITNHVHFSKFLNI